MYDSSTTVQILFTRSFCEYWHPPEGQFYKTETGCKAGDKCLFPHYKVGEQPIKKPKKGYLFPQKKRKRRQECSSYFEKCTTIGLRLARIGFSKRKTAPGKPDAKSLGINSKSTGHPVYAPSSKYLGKRKDHRLEKFKSNLLVNEVPTL